VDSEVALANLSNAGYSIVNDAGQADIAVVNTCGFIEAAKAESIEAILELCELKKKGQLKAVVILGCLAQRYADELRREIPEVDAIIGTNHFGDLAQTLEPLKLRHETVVAVDKPCTLLDEHTPRHLLTPPYTAYVKISEGCLHACTYCVIPKMKGPHRSRTIESILAEIQTLSDARAVSEVNLIGQDTAAFGHDRGRVFQLPELLRRVARETKVPWIRLLYAHPAHVSDELMDVMASEPRICKYVDFPIEHCHPDILNRMNRGVAREEIEHKIERMRQRIPGVSIRTSVIVGFPGETEEHFADLMQFLKQIRFDRLGAFKYSQEEGSRAATFPDQVPEALKEERLNAVMEQQREIALESNRCKIGSRIAVLIEEPNAQAPLFYFGRTQHDAPDVDNRVMVRSTTPLAPGRIIECLVTGALEYDLVASAGGA